MGKAARKIMISCLAVFFAATFFMTGGIDFAEAKAYQWKLGHPAADGSLQDKTAKAFAKLVKDKTNGQVVIDVYPAEQLGPWGDEFDSIMRGTQEMGFMPISPQFDPKLQVVYMVYLVDNWEDGLKVFEPGGWMFNFLDPLFGKLGLKPLGFSIIGFDGYASTKGPVVKPEDIKPLKTRVSLMTNKLFFDRVGSTTVNISFSELFTSLQTGVCHAQDNTPETTYLQLRDVTKYYTTINHIFEPLAVLVNLNLWKKLPSELKATIQESATEALAKGNAAAEQNERDYLQKMREFGIQVTDLTPEQRELWKRIGRASWQDMETHIGKDTIEYLMKYAK